MIKKSFLSILFLFIFLIISINFSQTVQNMVLSITDKIKLFFLDRLLSIDEFIKKHLNQAETIAELNKKVIDYEKNLYLLKAAIEEIKSLKSAFNSKIETNTTLHITKVISYVALGDFYKVWLEAQDLPKDRIYGLIYKGSVAGIAKYEDDRLMGILNGDQRCSYSVFIGKNKAPGIIKGDEQNGELIIDYIPSWIEIDTNQTVVTSGMDSIFFEGIPVGVITKIEKTQGYQKAWLRPKENIFDAKYFFLVDIKSSH